MLSQQDLLDISEEITQAYAPHESHHQSELVIMPVDPINLYAYWNLKDSEIEDTISNTDKQLALRIYSIPELSEKSANIQLSFDIKVYGLNNQQKVHLPVAASAYSAVIGEINTDNSFSTLAASDTIHVPRENPVCEKAQNDNEGTPKLSPKAENTFQNTIGNQESLSPDSAPFFEQLNQILNSHITTQTNIDETGSKTLLVQDFNHYGYDLQIHENDFNLESKAIFPEKKIDIQRNSDEVSPIDTYNYAQGYPY